ncbi:protein Simiate [Pseudomyrmex gracilis]|uniref:protein Simiate n=1 Tax=Pseudomyrmex gracilis TaxID=219809 RepID=UPI0009958217|nr:protein Simiate [Pseudomyrmex gracilis]
MNLESEMNEPESKRLKSEHDHEMISCKEQVDENGDEREPDSDNEVPADDCDDESFTFPPDENVSDMLDEVRYNGYFPTITDRYLKPYYKINVQFPGDDICIRVHSNRICMLSLAPSHVVLQGEKVIKNVNFKVSDKLDRSLNKVKGKGKHGAQPLQTNSNICTISCADGKTYVIKCCMIGKLVEINEMLLENPQLLREPPHRGGYLAIILPNINLLDSLKESLLTHEQYTELVEKREEDKQRIKLESV